MEFTNIAKRHSIIDLFKSKDKIKGGKADNMTCEQIAKKHGVSKEHIDSQVSMGINHEKEHTSNEKLAKEIAKDHLVENPNYYTELKKIEKAVYKDTSENRKAGRVGQQFRGKNESRKKSTRPLTAEEKVRYAEGSAKTQKKIDALVKKVAKMRYDKDMAHKETMETKLKTIQSDHPDYQVTKDWIAYYKENPPRDDSKIEKAVYKNTSENRKAGRVGQKYGGGKQNPHVDSLGRYDASIGDGNADIDWNIKQQKKEAKKKAKEKEAALHEKRMKGSKQYARYHTAREERWDLPANSKSKKIIAHKKHLDRVMNMNYKKFQQAVQDIKED